MYAMTEIELSRQHREEAARQVREQPFGPAASGGPPQDGFWNRERAD